MKKCFVGLLTLVALLISMPAALAAEGVQTAEFSEYIDFSEMPVVSFFSSAEWESGWTEYKDQLTGDARIIYEKFEEAFDADSMSLETVYYSNGTSASCWMKNITYSVQYASGKFNAVVSEWYEDIYDDAVLACRAFAYDHPEYFWIRQSCSTGYSASGSGGVATITLRVGFGAQPSCDTREERDALQEKLTTAIEELLAEVKGMTTVQKLEYFDNWLAANNHYNHAAAYNDDYIKTDDTPWSIVGALLDGYSPVCEGYAKAFQLLCHEVGVPCVQVSGSAGGGGHMWTAAELGNVWYFCDPTWDDPTINGGTTRDYSTREYFLTAQPGSHTVGMPLITPTISDAAYSDDQQDTSIDLEKLLTDWAGESVKVETVQQTLAGRESELVSKLTDENSGVTELIREVEETLTDVTLKINTDDAAVFAGADVVGAKLNAAADAQSVVLKIAKAAAEHENSEEYSAMTAFSMTLEGAVDADAADGLQVIVPVKITLPVPADINPAFLVVLHYKADGVEEIVPHVYQQDGRWYASFVVTSFSDFAMAAVTIEGEVTEGGVQVKLDFAVDLPGSAVCAVYDRDGKMIGVTVLEHMTAEEPQELTIACDTSKAHTVKLFVLDGSGVPMYLKAENVLSKEVKT